MSNKITRCNYCKYCDIIGLAIKEHKRIELRVDDSNVLSPAQALYVDGEFQAWFMELPDHCCCD